MTGDPLFLTFSEVLAIHERMIDEFGGDPEVLFIRGDVNADQNTDITDAITILLFLFLGGAEPVCLDAADTDDNGSLNLTDAVCLLNFLFLGGPAPEDPFPNCSPDPTIDDFTCESFESCL